MKLSVSLSDDDVATIDEYARTSGFGSRSAVVQHAVRSLRLSDLEDDYAAAWQEWEASGDESVWRAGSDDGLA